MPSGRGHLSGPLQRQRTPIGQERGQSLRIHLGLGGLGQIVGEDVRADVVDASRGEQARIQLERAPDPFRVAVLDHVVDAKPTLSQ